MTGSDGTIVVRPLDAEGEPRWEAFVAQAPGATFFHRAGWRRTRVFSVMPRWRGWSGSTSQGWK